MIDDNGNIMTMTNGIEYYTPWSSVVRLTTNFTIALNPWIFKIHKKKSFILGTQGKTTPVVPNPNGLTRKTWTWSMKNLGTYNDFFGGQWTNVAPQGFKDSRDRHLLVFNDNVATDMEWPFFAYALKARIVQ
jgi:hypothetical protein